jgi:hypothetical protein
MVLRDGPMDNEKKILIYFENRPEKLISPKELEKATKLESRKVRSALNKLLSRDCIVRVERGKYRYLEPVEQVSEEEVRRYLKALEKTSEIAIHELMLTESIVGEEEKKEIEHQIAYFAKKLVKARWELEHGLSGDIPLDEGAFSRANKIHQWSKYMFELSRKKRRKK